MGGAPRAGAPARCKRCWEVRLKAQLCSFGRRKEEPRHRQGLAQVSEDPALQQRFLGGRRAWAWAHLPTWPRLRWTDGR
eukprot:Skav225075  [mRNA]  locus=scaffold987:29004:29240:- [translate_table: standard]